jgi:hypothetical protein
MARCSPDDAGRQQGALDFRGPFSREKMDVVLELSPRHGPFDQRPRGHAILEKST